MIGFGTTKIKPMTYVVEYSKSQKCYHVSSLLERLNNEAICKMRGVVSDYEVIKEFPTRQQAYDHITEIYLKDIFKKVKHEHENY